MGERATRAPVGIIGLGLMGEVYAQRLIDAKFPVVGFDIVLDAIGSLKSAVHLCPQSPI